MQSLAFHLFAVQFFSRPYAREDLVKAHTRLKTEGGFSLDGHLTIKFGAPLLEGPGETFLRATYAQPWPYQEERALTGADKLADPHFESRWLPPEAPPPSTEQLLDPYSELRWPAYALASFHLANPETLMPAVDVAVQCDLLQAMRGLLDAQLGGIAELKAMTDQFTGYEGSRFSYWTPLLDSVGNPVPVASGDYVATARGEPVGPGFSALRGSCVTGNGSEYCSLALVWSQAFSVSAEPSARVSDAQIQKRARELKTHLNTKEDLRRADECLQKSDLRGCISFAQMAVEGALRFYCNQWGVRFPSLPGIDFHQRIERVLKRAGRASYQAIDPVGLTDLLHLFRASLKAHEHNCYFHDDQLHKDMPCEISHVQAFLDAAIRFTFWIDSQA